ncbi:MAG: putative zinc protease [Alphaproteobacteria bacterium MarineAlpha9_Bin7]|nr:MAG: putative zinc protease [Alphaproteobacteria bacterium MarineAlpha9_Bin7]
MTPKVTTLDNGLRVISEEIPYLETASVGVWVDAGARCEQPETNGISHLLEHMAFKGTQIRSARDIAEEIEAVGGHLNAYTSREQTAYFAKVLKEDTPLALDILADILQNPAFDKDELEREQTVVVQEIGQAHDTPDDIIFDYFQDIAFPDQPLGRPVLGTSENVQSFTRDNLSAYMDQHYTPGRMVVSAAGNVDHDQLVELTNKTFLRSTSTVDNSNEEANYVGGHFYQSRDLEQVHLLIGFNGLAYKDQDYYALQVFSTLLGGGMSSRLFQKVREERGLAYSIYSFSTSYVDSGLFGIYAGTSAESTCELIETVCNELLDVVENIGATETARARAQLKSGLLMSLESTSARSEQLARQLLLFGRPISNAEVIEKIESADPPKLSAVAERIFKNGAPTIAALGPTSNMPDYKAVGEMLRRG